MRLPTLLAFLVSLPPSIGCQFGGKSSQLQADAREKETWSAPRFRAEQDDRTDRRARHVADLERAHDAAREGRLGEARLLYTRVLSEDGRNADAHQGLAILADRDEDFARAEEHYLAALELRPDDPDLLNNVGYSYLLQGRLPEAKRLLVRALEIEPGHTLATSNLGQLHARNGRFDEALALFRQVGTEEQAQAELAKYTQNPRPFPPESEFADLDDAAPIIAAGDPHEPDLRGLSFEQMEAIREQERLRSIAARKRREATEFEGFADDGPASFDGAPFANDRAADPNRGVRNAFAVEPGPTPGSRASGSNVVPVGFEAAAGGTAPPYPPEQSRGAFVPNEFDRTGPVARADFNTPLGSEAPPAAGSEFSAPPTEFWPPKDTSPATPPWPGAGDAMPDRMTTDVRPRGPAPERGPVIRPNPIQQRAAILGMNAGSGLPLPIESSSVHTANRRGFDGAPSGPSERRTPRTEGATPPTVVPASAIGAPRPGELVAPAPWSESADASPTRSPRGPLTTTAMVPSDPSLYRMADGRPLGTDSTAAPYGSNPRSGRLEDWPELRRELNESESSFANDRRRLQYRPTGHPGFPDEFGPPTTQPRPRPTVPDAR